MRHRCQIRSPGRIIWPDDATLAWRSRSAAGSARQLGGVRRGVDTQGSSTLLKWFLPLGVGPQHHTIPVGLLAGTTWYLNLEEGLFSCETHVSMFFVAFW